MENANCQRRKRGRPRRKPNSSIKDSDEDSQTETSFLTFVTLGKCNTTNGSAESFENKDPLEEDVKAVLEELLCAVEAQIDEEKEPDAQFGNGKGRRGAKRRVSYDIVFKATVLTDLKHGRTRPVDVAEKHKIHKSLVTKWQKQEKEIMEAASKDHKKALKRRRPKSKKKHANV